MGFKIDGISASEHLDSSGEVLKIDGHDISDLNEGKGVLNWEHENGSSEDIIGAIIYAKKIKKKSDCEDERQEMYWEACKVPFVYIIAELFDDEEHPGAVAAAALIRYYKNRGLKVLAGFSVEGATLDKEDNVLKRSVGRRVALTLRPCNKSAISDVYHDPKNKSLVKFMQLDKPIETKVYEVPDIIFSDIKKSEHVMRPAPSQVHQRNRIWAMEDGALDKADLPEVKPVAHNQKVRDIADSYAKKKGFNLVHNNHQVDVHPEMAAKVANAYASMPHTPNDPATQKAYKALIDETKDQFEHLKQNGFKFSRIQPGQDNPYKSSKDLFKDVHENNHAWYFPTDSGFGTEGQENNDHPLLQKVKTSEGEMHANDLFRVVHDVFGHAKEGNGFGPKGEENAYRHHMQMYSPEAQKALTSETRGQNSWVNFGPHGEANRANPANTIYAEQKAGIMPDWTRGMWNGPSAQVKKSESLTKSIPENKIYLAFDGDNAGSQVEKAALRDDIAAIRDISDRISKGSQAVIDLCKEKIDPNVQVIVHGGDDLGLLVRDDITEEDVSQLRKEYYKHAKFTTTAGIGKSIPEATRALLYGKVTGKDKTVKWSKEVDSKLDGLKQETQEEKVAGILGKQEKLNSAHQKVKKSEDPLAELRSTVASLKKTLTAGGSNVAPGQLTGGAALVVEDIAGKKKKRGMKPETEKKLRNVIAAWDGKSSLAATIKAALPEVNDNYIDHFAKLAEEYTLKKAVNHMEHCDNDNASIGQDNLVTGINVFAHEGKDRFVATNYAGKPVLVVCCDKDEAKRATKFYEFVSTIFPAHSACVPMTNWLEHPALAKGCAYVQLLPEDHAKNSIMNPNYYKDFQKDSWILHSFALIDLITGAYQDRTELDTLCGQPPMFLGNTQAFHYDNFGAKPFYLNLIGTELLHVEAVQLLHKVDVVDLAVFGKYSLDLHPGEIQTMVKIVEQLKTIYHGQTINQIFNAVTDGIKNET